MTASKLSNFAILTISPLLLVRILDVADYGKYQEFMIYAMLFVTICGFGVDSSLTYFLPRYPDQKRQFVSQNSMLVLAASSVCMVLFLLTKQQFLKIASYDYVLPLAAYVLCFVNLNWLEYYWISQKRADLILYYSAGRLTIRVSVLVFVAYVTRDLKTILWSLVAVEALRLLLVAAFLIRAKLLTVAISRKRIKEQMRFAGPIGMALLTQHASRNIGKLFIGSALGPVALAHYAVASYLLPMVRIIQGSIADVVFPELVRAKNQPAEALRLWQRANVMSCALMFPPFVLLNWYAHLFVETLFTAKYAAAVPVLHVYLFWLVRRCFNSDVLLRTSGKTGFMLTGTALSVAINLVLMVCLYYWLGLIGPAIAFLLAETLLEVYNVWRTQKEFRLTPASLVDWRNILRIVVGCIVAIPLLPIADHLPGPELLRAVVASFVFTAVCWLIAYRLGVSDIAHVAQFALSRARR